MAIPINVTETSIKALSVNDPVSHANSEDYITEHLDFDWTVYFEKETIEGSVTLHIKNLSKKQAQLNLDCKYLNIKDVFVNKVKTTYQIINSNVEALGSCLKIPITIVDEKFSVLINYSTTDKCTALQWLNPEATLGGKLPYLFSQCEAIHARSLFPCQDSPSVKSTYSAQVKAPNHFNVLMSAIKSENPTKEGDHLQTIHKFEQKIKIPSYLVAIVCGNLEGRKLSNRSTVWSEPENIDAAEKEFCDTEKFLTIAENICGPYVWGIYDLLVLPPSFPYGGMENPCLTFITPTLIVGDKSLVHVVAHEITHSWTGNLVTNKTWEDFWLNEGHTRYVERLIMGTYHNSEPMRHLLIDAGLAELQESLNSYGKDHPFNQLIPTLVGCDPDDAFSRVPYEKGSNLLFYLESICGKDKMLRWLKCYIEKFKLKSLTSDEWKTFFYEYMIEKEKVTRQDLESVNWQEWFYGRWTIPVEHKLDRHFGIKCENLADKWIKLSDITDSDKDNLLHEYESFLPEQKYYFLQILNDFKEAKLDSKTLKLMGDLYGYTSSSNSEILFGWSMLCIRSRYNPAIEQIFEFLNSQGRLRYSRPIYKALFEWDDTKKRTVENFKANQKRMHPILSHPLKAMLQIFD